ncbi:MAG: ABC transporter ATP-binding protein [Sporichthyaceae bacterium]|nr:ABC transporter ATP-binding protein [Sporichthyaceae bacterium]
MPTESAVIVADNVGIRFTRNRKRRLRVRELFIHGSKRQPLGDEFWAFRNVSFRIAQGEAVGLIGANGQGKSTLLRLIAGVMLPDEGTMTVTEDVAPLIELSSGMVSDLTARDNIFLSAGLHGLPRSEVEERFEEIVQFAELEAVLDTPVRHFSSGMKARLAFAVATRLDAPIILVDEVLAVGDRRFRKKCQERMEEMVSGGRTLFLVSHSESDLKRFCTRGLYLRNGQLVGDGPLDETLAQYAEEVNSG